MGPAEVTTVIATRNRWEDLRNSVPRHTGPVVLVDNGSEDGTPSRVRSAFPHVTVIELPRNLGAVARNVGVQAARTPLVAFADDDSWWEPGAMELARWHFDRYPRLGLLAARILVGAQGRLDPTCGVMAQSPLGTPEDLPGPRVLGFVACGAVVRRSAFLQAGGFDDIVFFMGEEERLALDLTALGWGLSYVPAVVARHHVSADHDASSRAREILISRNRLLTAVQRRPWAHVARVGFQSLHAGGAERQGLARALPRMPRALAARRSLPQSVEDSLRLLEAAG